MRTFYGGPVSAQKIHPKGNNCMASRGNVSRALFRDAWQYSRGTEFLFTRIKQESHEGPESLPYA